MSVTIAQGQVTSDGAQAQTSTTQTQTSEGAGQQTSVNWYDSFNPDLKGYVQNKGFKDAASAIESYRNLEKLQGVPAERLLKLPERSDAPEWNDVYKRLGRPDKAEEYGLKPKEGDASFGEWAEKTAHSLNLSRDQAVKFAEAYTKFSQAQMQAKEQARETELNNQEANLKKEWGAAFDQKVAAAAKASKQFGIDKEMVIKLEDAMGFDKTMKFLASLGEKVGEDDFVGAETKNGNFNALTPDAARAKINQLKSDKEFTAKFLSGDVVSRELWEKLHIAASA